MSLKPWYRVVTPREDLRESKPLDAVAPVNPVNSEQGRLA